MRPAQSVRAGDRREPPCSAFAPPSKRYLARPKLRAARCERARQCPPDPSLLHPNVEIHASQPPSLVKLSTKPLAGLRLDCVRTRANRDGNWVISCRMRKDPEATPATSSAQSDLEVAQTFQWKAALAERDITAPTRMPQCRSEVTTAGTASWRVSPRR